LTLDTDDPDCLLEHNLHEAQQGKGTIRERLINQRPPHRTACQLITASDACRVTLMKLFSTQGGVHWVWNLLVLFSCRFGFFFFLFLGGFFSRSDRVSVVPSQARSAQHDSLAPITPAVDYCSASPRLSGKFPSSTTASTAGHDDGPKTHKLKMVNEQGHGVPCPMFCSALASSEANSHFCYPLSYVH
jgi:hypothetical protein